MAHRIIIDALLLLALFIVPVWVSGIFIIALLFIFPQFYEAIAAGVILDALYSQETASLGGIEFFFTLTALLLVLVVRIVKQYTRTHVAQY